MTTTRSTLASSISGTSFSIVNGSGICGRISGTHFQSSDAAFQRWTCASTARTGGAEIDRFALRRLEELAKMSPTNRSAATVQSAVCAATGHAAEYGYELAARGHV
jgi:hypothetical protein